MRIPGVASISDAAKNIGSTINIGFDGMDYLMGNHVARDGYHNPFNFKSVGGALTLGGFAPLGAAAGAALGAFGEGDVGTYAAVGAAIGVGVPLAVGASAAVAYKEAEAIGKGIYNYATSTLANSKNIGEAAAGFKPVGNFIRGAINGVSGEGLGATALSPVRRHINAIGGFANSLIRLDKEAMNLSGVKLTGLGVAALSGMTVYQGAAKAMQASMNIHMGESDGMITTATPRVPSYSNNAGATGDLVFALNRNRRG